MLRRNTKTITRARINALKTQRFNMIELFLGYKCF